VQAFIKADGEMPKEVLLPRPAHREVAKSLVERREYAVVEVVAALEAFAQPELLDTDARQVGTTTLTGPQSNTDLVIGSITIEPKLL
jgi:hypothetical protein